LLDLGGLPTLFDRTGEAGLRAGALPALWRPGPAFRAGFGDEERDCLLGLLDRGGLEPVLRVDDLPRDGDLLVDRAGEEFRVDGLPRAGDLLFDRAGDAFRAGCLPRTGDLLVDRAGEEFRVGGLAREDGGALLWRGFGEGDRLNDLAPRPL